MLTQTLLLMVSNLRSEAGHSTRVEQGLNTVDTLKYLLRRTQEELWTAFVWPELQVRADVPLTPGTYLYSYDTRMQFDNVREVWAANGSGSSWSVVDYGISEDKRQVGTQLNSSTGDPVQYWESENPATGSPQFRVWPTPQTAGFLRMKGNRGLKALTADADVSTLDATCIILFAAAELLARSKAEDAANKLQKAQRHLTKLLGNQVNAKNKISTYGSMAPRLVTSR
jgi:hypothetical protein